MRKIYPYLKENYYSVESQAVQQRNFLSQIDDFVNQKQYVKITLLDWQERPLREIAGEITSGSITKDGASAVRRTLNLSCTVDSNSYDIDDLKSSFAINKKIYVEVGIKNYTDKYMDPTDPQNYFPILWFPQGVFFIGQLSVSASTTGLNLTITGKDKMCKLNGDIGGKFPATVVFNQMDVIDINGNVDTTNVRIYDIIQECVNHYGEEDLENIIIDDVPLQIKQVMSWNSTTPIYGYYQTDSLTQQNQSYILTYDVPADPAYDEYHKGDNVGYIYTDFVWVGGDLVAAPGESITSILDKIKSFLGNYEYFYDVYGIFHFQEIKNYLNTTLAKTVTDILEETRYVNDVLGQLNEKDYIIETTAPKSVYNFTDNKNLTQLTVNPQYENIRNDFIVLGETDGNIKSNVRYHLAIDNKPDTNIEYNTPMICYKRAGDNLKVLNVPVKIDTDHLEGDLTTFKSNYGSLNNYISYLNAQKQEALNNIETIQKQIIDEAFQLYANQLNPESSEAEFFLQETTMDIFHYNAQKDNDNKIIVTINEKGSAYTTTDSKLSLIINYPGDTWYNKYLNYINELQQQQQILLNSKEQIQISKEQVEERKELADMYFSLLTDNLNNIENLTQFIQDLTNFLSSSEEPQHQSSVEQQLILELALFNIIKKNIEINPEIKNNYTIINQIDNPINLEQEYKQKQFEEYIKILLQQKNVLPRTGNTGLIYYCDDPSNNIDTNHRFYFYWNNIDKQYELIDYITEYPNGYQTTNWQTHLYIMGLINHNLAKDSSQYINIKSSIENSCFNVSSTLGKFINADYYFEELNAFWPLVFDFEINDYYGSNKHRINQEQIINNINIDKNILENNLKIAQALKEEAYNQTNMYNSYLFRIQSFYDKLSSIIDRNNKSILSNEKNYQQNLYFILIQDPSVPTATTQWFQEVYTKIKNLWIIYFNSRSTPVDNLNNINDFFTTNNYVKADQLNIEDTTTYYIYKEALPAIQSLLNNENDSILNSLDKLIKECPYRINDINNPNEEIELEVEVPLDLESQKTWFENMFTVFSKIRNNISNIFNALEKANMPTKMFSSEEWVYYSSLFSKPLLWTEYLQNCINLLTRIKSLKNPSLDETLTENLKPKEMLNIDKNILPNQYKTGNGSYSVKNISDIWDPKASSNYFITLENADITSLMPERNEDETDYEFLKKWINKVSEYYNFWKTRNDYWTEIINALVAAIAQCNQSIVQRNLAQYNLYEGEYYLDFIDPRNSKIGEFCVSNIGRRQFVNKNTNINCLFALPIPDIIFINTNAEDATAQRSLAETNGLKWSQVDQEIYQNFAIGGWRNPAWETITNDLYLHTTYQKTISITALPAFYLEPNSRITINDRSTKTYGDYLITSITLPLGAGQLMSVSGSEILQQR